MKQSQRGMNNSHHLSSSDLIEEQTYWVNQVKQNPEEFEHYMTDKVLKKKPLRDLFHHSTQAYNTPSRKNRPKSAYPIKQRRPITGKNSLKNSNFPLFHSKSFI